MPLIHAYIESQKGLSKYLRIHANAPSFRTIDKIIVVGDAMLSLCSINLERKHQECQNCLKYANRESHYMENEICKPKGKMCACICIKVCVCGRRD